MTSPAAVVHLWIQSPGGDRRPTDVHVKLASTFWSRLIGLLGKRSLDLREGLLLDPCSSIHTIGMRFSIDVVFLDRAGCVLGFADDVAPNRVRVSPRGTSKVLEVAVGNRSRTGIHLDDYLIFD